MTVTSPYDNPQQISEDGTIAYAQLDISDRGFQEIIDLGTEIEEFGDSHESVAGLEVEYGGDPFSEFELPESEIYGIIAAVIILILAFGSVLAMGLPIGTALFGLGIATALVSLGSNVVDIPDFTTAMVAMIGLGVGIDYALFIVTRFREGLKLGLEVEDSVAESMDTSGRAVLFAGITVIISLMGLFLMGLSFVQGIAMAASLGVLMMMLGSLTLLPALLGWIGTRIDHTTRAALGAVALGVVGAFFGVITKQEGIFIVGMLAAVLLFGASFFVKSLRKEIPHRAEPVKEQRMWYRWSRFIQRRPWPPLIGATAVLVILAIPLFGIRLGFGDYGNYPEDKTVRRAYDLLAEGFGPGTNGPLFVTVEGETASDPDALERLRRHDRRQRQRRHGVPDADQRQPRAGDRQPGERPAGRRDDIARQPPARRRDPGVRRRCSGRRAHRRVDRLRRLHGRSHAAVDRRRPAAQLPAPDGGVPQPPRAAEGRGHEPPFDRRRLRDHRRHLPVGMVEGRRRSGPVRADRGLGADVHVRHRVRALDGLRGVPPFAYPRGVRPDQGQRGRRRRRTGVHGTRRSPRRR